jgi:hypothetical protein
MGNTSGQAYALMVMAPIRPDRQDPLREYLAALPTGEASPLARMGTTHFARWIVLDDLVYQGSPQQRDSLKSAYLIFLTNVDGDLDRYLADMLAAMPVEADEIWSNCVAFPGTADAGAFADYMKHNQIDTTFFVSAYPQATVAQVREDLRLRRDLADFAVAAQSMDPATLRDRFTARFLESV